jgi:hypothetical protein
MNTSNFLEERPIQVNVNLGYKIKENPEKYNHFLETEEEIHNEVLLPLAIRLPPEVRPLVANEDYDSGNCVFYIARLSPARKFRKKILETGLVESVYFNEIPFH